jgi:alpha 1,3-glucosidase
MQDEFLVGTDLLVKPVTSLNQSFTEVYLPGDQNSLWYDYETHLSYAGGQNVTIPTPLERIPVFVRGGAILPLQERLRRSTTQMINDPYTLLIALDANVSSL